MIVDNYSVFDDMNDKVLISLKEKYHKYIDYKSVYRYMNYKTYLRDHKYCQA